MNDALTKYMNQDSVKRALHIPPTIPAWQADSSIINIYNPNESNRSALLRLHHQQV
ncbi:hypothetical protein COOONC_11445 [Cooperia oncophora]